MKKTISIFLLLFRISFAAQTPPSTLITTWYNSLSVVPSNSLQTDINTLVDDIDADGNWQYIDFFAVIAGMETTEQSLIPLFTRSSATMTPINSPTIDANGVTGNNSTSYIKTGWFFNTDTLNYTRCDGYGGVYHSTQGNSLNRAFFGARPNFLMIRGSGNTVCNINFSSGGSFLQTLNLGYKAMWLSGSSGVDVKFYNGQTYTINPHNPLSAPTGELFICATSNGTSAVSFSNATIRVVIIGSNLIDSGEIRNRLNIFFASRGLTTY